MNKSNTLTLKGHHGSVNSIIQLKNGDIASCGDDTSIRIWDSSTGKIIKVLEEHFSRITCLVQLDDERLASGSFDTSIRLWNISESKCTLQLCEHESWLLGLLVLKDKRLASSSGDKTIKIWNLQKGRCALTFKGHSAWISTIIQLLNSNIASCSEDKTVRIWNINTAECLQSFDYNEAIISLCQLSNSRIILGKSKSLHLITELPDKNEIEINNKISITSNVVQLKDNTLAYGNDDGYLIIKDLDNKEGNALEYKEHDDTITCLIKLKDGRVATCSNDSFINIYTI